MTWSDSPAAPAVGGGHGAEVEGIAIWKNQATPDDERSDLTIGHLSIIAADEARALGDEDKATGGVVVDWSAHLGDHLAWQVGVDGGEEGGGDDRPGLDFVGGAGLLQPRLHIILRGSCANEGGFLGLAVLSHDIGGLIALFGAKGAERSRQRARERDLSDRWRGARGRSDIGIHGCSCRGRRSSW